MEESEVKKAYDAFKEDGTLFEVVLGEDGLTNMSGEWEVDRDAFIKNYKDIENLLSGEN